MLFRRALPVAALFATALIGASALAVIGTARAQSGLWAVSTDACTPDGTRCIRGIVKDGAPFTSRAECERHAQALLRQYMAANFRVSYMACVQI